MRPDLYVVLAGPDGQVGAITVTQGADRVVLDRAYAVARFSPRGRLEVGRASDQEVRDVFGAALAAQPAAPVSFRLNFVLASDELTPESTQLLPDVLAEIARRPAAEVVVVGHTDRIGTVQRNDVLSLQRAERVQRELVRIGIPADRIEIAGRGSREPLFPSDAGVEEPRNRRVEITVR